ncbi:MAG: helix-turn-helix transcriptional regulator [Planctomycetaceae bacterium]
MTTASGEYRETDTSVVDLLRGDVCLGIGDLATRLGVTATAVRQRLDRLMRAGIVERSTVSKPRGRPSHSYRLTAAGRRLGGDNFRDLAMVLWREVRAIPDAAVRRGLLQRIAGGLAEACRERISGESPRERLAGLAALMSERDIACCVEQGELPVLTTYSCPYPELADEDRSVCVAERLMIQELVGTAVRLSECRLDGAPCCRFTAGGGGSGEACGASKPGHGLETNPVAPSNADRLFFRQAASESSS